MLSPEEHYMYVTPTVIDAENDFLVVHALFATTVTEYVFFLGLELGGVLCP